MSLLSKNICTLYVSDTQLSIAEFQVARNEPEFKTVYSIDFPTNIISHGAIKNKAEFTKILKQFIADARLSGIAARDVILMLPEQQIYMSVLHFTSSKLPEEILEEVPREALATIPLDPRNIYCDFFHVPVMEKRHEVMYVAADKNVIDAYLELLIGLGLQPMAIVTEPDALFASCLPANNAKESTLILSIGKRRSYWVVVEGGTIKKIAPSKLILNVGDIASDEAVEMLQAEAQVVLSGYQAAEEKHAVIKQIFLWSDMDSTTLPLLAQRMATLLHIDVFPLQKRFPDQASLVQKMWGALLVFIKNSSNKELRFHADLLPKRLRDQATLLLINTFVTIFSIMVMLAASGAISVFSYAWSEMYFENQRAHRESSGSQFIMDSSGSTRYAEIKKKTLDFNSEVDALIQIQSKLFSYHTIWEALRSVIFSQPVTATSIEYNAKDLNIRITGIAQMRDDLTRLKRKLEALPFVLEVVSPLSNLDKTTNVSFLFTVKLNPKTLPYLTN